MILYFVKESLASKYPFWITIMPILISAGFSFLGAFFINRRELKKIRLQHQQQLDMLRKEKQEQLQHEIDKLQAEAFCQLFEPLKYVSKNPDNPYAMFVVEKNGKQKNSYLLRKAGENFLKAINRFLYSKNGELFLPRQFRNDLYSLRGLVHGILKESRGQERIELQNRDALNRINVLVSGDENLHKQLRCLMGTEDRKPMQ